MKLWKKVIMGSASLVAITLLAACGSGSSSSDSSTKSSTATKISGDVTLWVDTAQVPSYKKLVASFKKKYPDVNVKLTQSPNGSSNAKTDVGKDPAKAADVFQVPNDQLGQMADAGYINPLSPDAEKEVKADNIDMAATAMTWKDKMYGYPWAQQANTLYYNKSKLSADDVKSWDSLTAKGVIGLDFTVPYNVYPVFLTAGTKLYGDDGETLDGSTVASDEGVAAMKWFSEQKANKGVMQTSNALNQLKAGKVGAIIDGPWDATNIKNLLGDNFAVTTLPTLTINGEQKQMQAFIGVMAFAVNSHTATKNQKAAQTLAAWVTNKAGQTELYKSQGQIPVNKEALDASDVKADPVAVAVDKQSAVSTLMPKMPQMATVWNDAAALTNGAYTGSIKAADYMTQLQKFQDAISKK
ncbi:extracellular solute-binding protein [Lacticaseibacillus mingshuiensis]|uniref:extracellular solute-binding protein n=1 Tax=Lacticaseibacillus mingshuiensis TaxID=2799574 RepID=UPI00194E637A|nr:extracellular solute-binding protein [Lacticaseibacillus mingshuiensis]